jgi:hypothetical protein
MRDISRFEENGWHTVTELPDTGTVHDDLFRAANSTRHILTPDLKYQGVDRLTVVTLETSGHTNIAAASSLGHLLTGEVIEAGAPNDQNSSLRVYRNLPAPVTLAQEYYAYSRSKMGVGGDAVVGFVDLDFRPGQESYLGCAYVGRGAIQLYSLNNYGGAGY